MKLVASLILNEIERISRGSFSAFQRRSARLSERPPAAVAGADHAPTPSSGNAHHDVSEDGMGTENALKAGLSPANVHVLLVDDDIEIIEAARYALEGAGHNVVVARDGNQGLALAERENPDLIILDMMMPKRSGFLVLEKLRRLRSELLPVIMITGNEGSRHKAYAELLGVSDYIRKPFPMERLISSVDKLIGS